MNIQSQVQKWKIEVDNFYKGIESFLKLHNYYTNRRNIEKTEQNFVYNIDVLDISNGSKTITLDPLGTFVVGFHGRIDLTGSQQKFVLSESGKWRIWNKITNNDDGEFSPERLINIIEKLSF